MSRIGKSPIKLPKDVFVNRYQENIVIYGPYGFLEIKIPSIMDVKISTHKLIIKSRTESREVKILHGLFRALINNMVIGVLNRFTIILELKGVGYRCQINNDLITLNLGYSHNIEILISNKIDVTVENNTSIYISGIDKEQIGLFASKIRGFRPPEPYNGKGVMYKNEVIRRKIGKVGK
jgi:large subunit ribosomal protein L6